MSKKGDKKRKRDEKMGTCDFQVEGAESVAKNAIRVVENLQALRFESGDRFP